jgi:hypothetical protein
LHANSARLLLVLSFHPLSLSLLKKACLALFQVFFKPSWKRGYCFNVADGHHHSSLPVPFKNWCHLPTRQFDCPTQKIEQTVLFRSQSLTTVTCAFLLFSRWWSWKRSHGEASLL